jgi:hypothetical protein
MYVLYQFFFACFSLEVLGRLHHIADDLLTLGFAIGPPSQQPVLYALKLLRNSEPSLPLEGFPERESGENYL